MARPEARPPPRPGCGLSRVRVRPRTRRRLGGVNARTTRPPARTSLPRARGPGRLVPAPFPWWPPHPDPHRDAPSGRERCLELSRAAQRPACLSHSNRTFYSVASMGLGSSHPGATSRNGEPALRQDTAAAARTQRRRGAGHGGRVFVLRGRCASSEPRGGPTAVASCSVWLGLCTCFSLPSQDCSLGQTGLLVRTPSPQVPTDGGDVERGSASGSRQSSRMWVAAVHPRMSALRALHLAEADAALDSTATEPLRLGR